MIERIGAIWSATNTLAFIRDELTGRDLLHQLWLDDLGLTEWRLVPHFPTMGEAKATHRNPALVGRVVEESSGDDALAIEDEQ